MYFNLLVSIWGRTRSGSDFVFWVKYLNILYCGLCWARIKVSVVLFRGYILVSEQTFLHYGVFVYQHILWHRFSIWKISKTNTIKFSSCHGPQKIKFSHKKLICSLPWPEQLEVELETNLCKDWSFTITQLRTKSLLLEPSPGWGRLPALRHLRHYQDTMLNRRWPHSLSTWKVIRDGRVG